MKVFMQRLFLRTILINAIMFLGMICLYSVALAEDTAKTTIAVLSHTDFLPDATGVYDRRSTMGRDKDYGSVVNNDMRVGNDQAYDNVTRTHGYAPEAVGLPELLADAILEQLAKSNRFIPVERKTLRTAILEQRFGQQITKNYLDRTLDKAIQDMDKFEIGGGVAMGYATAGSEYNDILHDFKDLGSAVGARFLVLGNVHQLGSSVTQKRVPLSESGRTVTQKTAQARLRLRVIDAVSSTVIGADSLNLKVSNLLFEGGNKSRDDFEFMEQVAKEAANKILDIVFPAKILSLEPLVISRGVNDGVANGHVFKIVREGKEIKEDSGIVIARLKSEIGTVKVTQVQETVSVAQGTGGGNFKTGDLAVRVVSSKVNPVAQSAPPLKNKETALKKGLPRIAVGLVKAGSTAITSPEAGKHVPLFTDTIITRFVQTKRFVIIDRQEIDQLLDEQMAQALANNTDLPSVMGSLKGCDYLVIGSLQNFSMEAKTIKLPHSTRVMSVLDGFAEGNMRLVDVRSGDIMESRKISVQTQLDSQAGEDRLVAALADEYAGKVVASLMNAVYPIKIAAVTPDGSVYLNRGADGLLQKGFVLDVVRPGQKIIDPDTGVALGAVESKLGQVELVQVEENRSIGNVLRGGGMQSGDLLKLTQKSKQQPAASAGMRTGGNLSGSQAVVSSERVQHSPEKKGKATLALAKINLNVRKKLGGKRVSAIQQGTMDRITDVLADSLDRTHRFTMMERREIDQIIDEKTFQAVASGADIREYLKNLQGADYLVVGELVNFYLEIVEKKVPYVDEVQVDITGFIEGNSRIVDSHTGAVVATEKIRIKKKFKQMGTEEIITKLIDLYGQQSASGIVQRIYPMKVLGVMADGTVFINRGTDAALKVGATFSIGRPGQELVDKDTGISFGVAETTIGTIKITAVEENRSRAIVVAGEMPIAGDILRNKKAPQTPKKKKKMKVSW